MKMALTATSAMLSVLVDALDRETLLAREDAMHVILSSLTRMTHRCVVCPLCASVCVLVCWCASAGFRLVCVMYVLVCVMCVLVCVMCVLVCVMCVLVCVC